MSPTTQREYLQLFAARWARFLERFDKSDTATPRVIYTLSAMYGGGDRLYHDMRHILDGLDMLETVRQEMPAWFTDPEEDASIELAWWHHDAIYSTTGHHSEKRSAELAGLHANELGFSDEVYLRSKGYVRATEHRRQMGWRRGASIVCDIDLRPLSYPWERFQTDTANIRKEYGHVPEDQWKAGRRDFLLKMLDTDYRPSIYQTDYFAERYEADARLNLMRAAEELV